MIAKPQMWWPGVNRSDPHAGSLQGLWPFGEATGVGIMDVSGYSRPVTLMAGPSWVGSAVGYGVRFIGASSHYAPCANYKGPAGQSAWTILMVMSVHDVGFGSMEPVLHFGKADGAGAGTNFNASVELGTFWLRHNAGVTSSWSGKLAVDAIHVVVCSKPQGGTNSSVRVWVDGLERVGTFGDGARVIDIGTTAVWEFARDHGTIFGDVTWYLCSVWDVAFIPSKQLFVDPFAMLRPPSIARRYVSPAKVWSWRVVPSEWVFGIARVTTLAWTSSKDGDVEYELDGCCGRPLLRGVLHRVETHPSETEAPDANWDCVLEDIWGVDVLGGLGMNRSATDPEAAFPYFSLGTSGRSERGVGGELTLKISGAGEHKSGVVRILTIDP